MDNIDWWAVLSAPPQSENQQRQHQHQLPEPDARPGQSPEDLLNSLIQTQHNSNNDAPGPTSSLHWPPQQHQQQHSEAELLAAYLAQTPRYQPQPQPPAQHEQPHDSTFRGLPDWLFPPAVEPQAQPAGVPDPPHRTQPPPVAVHSKRGRSRGSSTASTPTPNISRRPSPTRGVYSPAQLHEVSASDVALQSLPSASASSASSRPLPSRSMSYSSGIEPEDAEDKRIRNTQASARFRAKKKQQSQSLQRGIEELETRHAELERDVTDLRRENGFLKDMVMLKWGSGAAHAAGVPLPLPSPSPVSRSQAETPLAGSAKGDDDDKMRSHI